MDDEYDESKETVKEWIERRLMAELKKELDGWSDSVLYGNNSGGDLKGLFDNG